MKKYNIKVQQGEIIFFTKLVFYNRTLIIDLRRSLEIQNTRRNI